MTIPKLEPHHFSQMFPPISGEDFTRLAHDIKTNGMHQPIVRYQGKILDGNNRYRACDLAKIEPTFADFDGTDAQAQAYVISANIHRRHLTAEKKRELIAMLIGADPSKSNRQIAETAKVSHHTVGEVRAELEATGQTAQLEKTTGKDGKARKTKKSKAKKSTKEKDTETIKYQVVVDGVTAHKAYQLFEGYLLDVLGEVSEYIGNAEDYAQGTINKLNEKLEKLSEEEEEEQAAA